MRPAEAKRLLALVRRGWRCDELEAWLTALYPGAPRLTVGASVYPAAVWAHAAGADPDDALEPPSSGPSATTPGDWLVSQGARPDPAYREWLAALGARVWNGRTYTLRRRLDTDGGPRIALGFGRFFDALDTCDVLSWELLTVLGERAEAGATRVPAASNPLALLPRRRALHEATPDPLSDGSTRSAALAVATLVAFRSDGRTWLLLRRRSDQGNARLTDVAHVLPSGMFQPVFEPGADVPLWPPSVDGLVRCELLEELYGLDEASAARAVYREPAGSSPHLQALAEAEARHELLGMSVDLLTLRPELLTLLWIPRESWYRAHVGAPRSPARAHPAKQALRVALNEEWGEPIVRGPTPLGAVPFDPDPAAQLQVAPLGPAHLAPSGAAALWLGHGRMRRLLGATGEST